MLMLALGAVKKHVWREESIRVLPDFAVFHGITLADLGYQLSVGNARVDGD